MSPEQDPPEPDETEREPFDDGQRRTMFSATWFRAIIVLVVLGVIAAVAVPYVLEMMNPPVPIARPPVAAKAPPAPAPVVVPAPPAAKKEPANAVLTPPTPTPAPPKGDATVTAPPRPSAPPKTEARKRPATKKEVETRRAAKATTPSAGGTGAYWVQVGAFKDPETAKRVAARLREAQFPVEESVKRIGEPAGPTSAAGPSEPAAAPDRYDVLVSGGSLAEINARLAAKGLAAEPSGSGVAIRPSLPLRDAVALSKDLAADGLKVQVKRATAAGAGPAGRAAASAAGSGVTLHRVRVGAFPDRAAAQTAARDLEARGYTPFIARGRD